MNLLVDNLVFVQLYCVTYARWQHSYYNKLDGSTVVSSVTDNRSNMLDRGSTTVEL